MNQSKKQMKELEQLVDTTGMYVVQKITKKKSIIRNGKTDVLYFVRWKDYPELKDHTWQPLENLSSVSDMVKQFQQRLKKQTNVKKTQSYNKQPINIATWQLNNSNGKERKMQLSSKGSAKKPIKNQSNQKSQSSRGKRQERRKREYDIEKIQKFNTKLKEKLRLTQRQQGREIRRNKIMRKQLVRQNGSTQLGEQAEALKPQLEYRPKLTESFMKKQEQINFLKYLTQQQQKQTAKRQYEQLKYQIEKQKYLQLKTKDDEELTYGQTFNYVYKDGELHYQIKRVNSLNKAVDIALISSAMAKKEALLSITEFLQRFIKQLQETTAKSPQNK